MSWSFGAKPANDIDRIRTLVGDTDKAADFTLQNEEIVIFLGLEGQYGSTLLPTATGRPLASRTVLYRAAAAAARALAGKYAGDVNVRTADQSEQNAGRIKAFQSTAALLEQKAACTGVGPRVGGLSIGEKLASRQDTDLPQPYFRRDMMTEPGTGPDFGELDDQAALEFAP